MNNKRNHIHSYILFIILIFMLNGCQGMTQIEDKDFVLAVGVGYTMEKYQITFAKPNLGELTGQPVGENEKFVVTYQGAGISNIEEDYARNSSKRLDLSHLKTIILDYSIIGNKEKLDELLRYIGDDNEISRNTLVFYTDEEANSMLELDENKRGNIGDNIEKMYDNNPYNSDTRKVTIGDMINGLYQSGKVHVIPRLETNEDLIWISGAGLFFENEFVEFVNEDDLTYINLMNGIGKGRTVELEDGGNVKIKEIKSKYNFSVKDKKPNVKIHITGKGKTQQKGIADDTNRILNNSLKNRMTPLFEELVNEKKVDYMNLYRKLSYKDRSLWNQYENNQEQLLSHLTMDLIVEFELE